MNYYDTLEIKKDATEDDIKKSFRKLSKLYHPDTTTDVDKKKELEEKFKKINEAYSVLSDPQKRAEFDNPPQMHHNPFMRGNPFMHADPFSGHGINLDEILNNVNGFRFSFGGGNHHFHSTQMINHTITIDLIKALEGGDIEADIPQLGKRIKFELPPDINNGASYKIRVGGDNNSDIFLQLTINVELPRGVSKEKIEKIKDLLAPEVAPEPATSSQ